MDEKPSMRMVNEEWQRLRCHSENNVSSQPLVAEPARSATAVATSDAAAAFFGLAKLDVTNGGLHASKRVCANFCNPCKHYWGVTLAASCTQMHNNLCKVEQLQIAVHTGHIMHRVSKKRSSICSSIEHSTHAFISYSTTK